MPGLIVTEEDRLAFAHHVYVDETHRLVFFTIPKVACTPWMQLFARLRGIDDWRANPHYRKDRRLLSHLPADRCTEILNDPAWFRAVFFRDPVERFLSAYLDKFVRRKSYPVQMFGPSGGDVSLDTFLEFVLDPNVDPDRPEGLHEQSNPHWRPQTLVGNAGKFLPVIDFVGRFTHLHEDAASLLKITGLWTDHGASGWGPGESSSMFEENDAFNATHARRELQDRLAPDDIERLRRAYAIDYERFATVDFGRPTAR